MNTILTIPDNWVKIEEEDDFIIFEDKQGEFSVVIEFDGNFNNPYSIFIQQLKGNLVRITKEEGLYIKYAKNKSDAVFEAGKMMKFIDEKRLYLIPVTNRMFVSILNQDTIDNIPIFHLDEASYKAKSLIENGHSFENIKLVNENNLNIGSFNEVGELSIGN